MQEQDRNKELLISCLTDGFPMLFTGAGFSLGAENGNGDKLPGGKRLKEMLLRDILDLKEDDEDYKELINTSLAEVAQECVCYKGNPNVLTDYLTSIFLNCTPQDYHRTIASYPWQKIYTTNIDDVLENSVSNNAIQVQNMKRLQKNDIRRNKIQYFKLHGCVRNPSGGYVFSTNDYNNEISLRDNALINTYSNDIQVQDFIFLGFDDHEMDIDLYLKQYEWRSSMKPEGRLFFINPKPSRVFRTKVATYKGYIIEMTTQQFAELLTPIIKKKEASRPDIDRDISNFTHVNREIKLALKNENYKSSLLSGDAPTWEDIVFEWDALHPFANEIVTQIISATSNKNKSHLLWTITGTLLQGKTVLLKRIGRELVKNDFSVYETRGMRFDFEHFGDCCSRLPDEKIALLVDNSPYFYQSIANLLERFPEDKTLVVVSAGQKSMHDRQKYALRSLGAWWKTFNYTAFDYRRPDISRQFAENLASMLERKGMLSYLSVKTEEERVKDILKTGDICMSLYKLTESENFAEKFRKSFNKFKDVYSLQNAVELLFVLAVFQKFEIPGLPHEILGLWKRTSAKETLIHARDYIRNVEKHISALRNSFITDNIIKELSKDKQVDILAEILCLIAPQRPIKGRDMWTMMQEQLMKTRNLREHLKWSTDDIQRLYNRIRDYYENDHNYWIQVGTADQMKKDYDKAHAHLKQAEGLNSTSYIVQHALGRNYLLRAVNSNNSAEALSYFEEGQRRMILLIEEKESEQTKAYSVHCYVKQSIAFWQKFSINPTDETIDHISTLLEDLIHDNQADDMTYYIEKVFKRYVAVRNRRLGRSNTLSSFENLDQYYFTDEFKASITDDELPEI